MTSIPLNPADHADLQPIQALWQLYRPQDAPYRFEAQDGDQARAWQTRTRAALREAIGMLDLPPAPLDAEILEEVDLGDVIRSKVLIRTSSLTLMPIYLLRPKGAQGKLPVVLAFAGHGYGAKDIVGLWENGEERRTPEAYHYDFGLALCRKGFMVAAPEISCFGERVNDYVYLDQVMGQPIPSTCHHTATLAFHLGGSAVGMRVLDGMRLVDYLETLPDADITRLGAMGISGGGMHTFFSTALDERIRACVISGYFCTFRHSIFNMNHCTCNYVPGLHRFGEIYDLAGLIAPRPMLVEDGTHDPIFPIAGVHEAVARANEVYRVFGVPQYPILDEFEGRHQIHGARAYDFLWESLVG